MATTFPCIGPLMKSLNTRWGALDGAASSSYAMGSMGGRGEKYANSSSVQHGKRSRHSQLASKIGTGSVALTPHANNYSSRIGADQAERRPSIGSDGSEQMIIRKTVETIVEREAQSTNIDVRTSQMEVAKEDYERKVQWGVPNELLFSLPDRPIDLTSSTGRLLALDYSVFRLPVVAQRVQAEALDQIKQCEAFALDDYGKLLTPGALHAEIGKKFGVEKGYRLAFDTALDLFTQGLNAGDLNITKFSKLQAHG
ncbi:hypothetical protein LTR27_003946 [Elasticomyces elasticus]|nr:hypothetical protein LTR27_003946 [Elasticomyces elasticus]